MPQIVKEKKFMPSMPSGGGNGVYMYTQPQRALLKREIEPGTRR
jgi:hypothetical protein